MKILDSIFAARPMLHVPVWTVYLISLHHHNRLSGEHFDLWDLATLAVLSLLFAGVYYINQVYDIESDRINGKLGFLHDDKLSVTYMSALYLIVTVVGVALGGLYPLFFWGLLAQIAFLGWAYSAPPLRLKDRPLWSLFVNAWCIGALIPLTTMPEINIHNAGLLGWDTPFYFLLAVASITILTMIPDREGDARTGKRTLAVALGVRWSLTVALVLMILAAVVAFRSQFAALFYLAGFASMNILMAILLPVERIVLIAIKLPLLCMIGLAGFHYPGYIAFIVALIFCTRIYYQKRFGILYPSLS